MRQMGGREGLILCGSSVCFQRGIGSVPGGIMPVKIPLGEFNKFFRVKVKVSL